MEQNIKAHELLSDPSKHCQRAYALNAEGENVLPDDPAAVRWDASGAIEKCYGGHCEWPWKKANALARARFGLPLSHVNDRLGYEAVMEILKDADV